VVGVAVLVVGVAVVVEAAVVVTPAVVGVAVVVEPTVVVTPVVPGIAMVVGTGSTISVLLLHAEANSTNTRTSAHDLIESTAPTLRPDQQDSQKGLQAAVRERQGVSLRGRNSPTL